MHKSKSFKKIIIRLLACIALLGLMVSLSSCWIYDDDWAPYKHYDKKLNYKISGNILKMDEVKDELTKIACSIEEDVELEFSHYKLYSLSEGEAEFQFTKYNEDKNQSYAITLYYDFKSNKVCKVNYKKGHPKRVSAIGSYDYQNKSLDIEKIYNEAINNEDFKRVGGNQKYYLVFETYIVIHANAFLDNGQSLYHFEDFT